MPPAHPPRPARQASQASSHRRERYPDDDWREAFDRHGALWRRLAEIAALQVAPDDLMLEKELLALRPALERLDAAGGPVQVSRRAGPGAARNSR